MEMLSQVSLYFWFVHSMCGDTRPILILTSGVTRVELPVILSKHPLKRSDQMFCREIGNQALSQLYLKSFNIDRVSGSNNSTSLMRIPYKNETLLDVNVQKCSTIFSKIIFQNMLYTNIYLYQCLFFLRSYGWKTLLQKVLWSHWRTFWFHSLCTVHIVRIIQVSHFVIWFQMAMRLCW